MQSTIERPVVPSPAPALVPHRTVTVLVRGQRVQVDCPDWCVSPHPENLVGLDDLMHEGAPVSVTVPTVDGPGHALVTRLAVWPFARSEDDRRPYLSVSIADGGDGADLQGRTTVNALADDLEQHAARLRTLAAAL